jgi:hypothetical protein
MSCCGQKRRALRNPIDTQTFEPDVISPTEPPAGTIFLEYVGVTAMTVIGPVTGIRYRFGWSGAQVAIDTRDAEPLSSVPHLRRVLI